MYQHKSYRKFLSTAVTAVIVVTAGAPIIATSVQAGNSFSDIASNAYYSEAVKDLANKGVIQGFSDGTFRPTQQMTRAEAAKMIVHALGVSTNPDAKTPFSDVKMGSWYTPYVAILSEKGIIDGYSDGTFKPNETITRAQMAKMLVHAFDELEEGVSSSFTDVNANSWYAPYVGALVEKEITTGTTKATFSPNQKVTRAEAATFLYRVNQLDENLQTIEKITDNQVTLNGVDYTISEELKGIFNRTNQAALTNANVSVVFKEGQITKIINLVLNTNGVEGTLVEFNANNATVSGDVRINADYVSVKNLKVTGNFEVSEKAKNVLYSHGLTVEGQVIISDAKVSAAMWSMLATQSSVVTFENANLNSVDIRKSDVRVEPKGNTTVKEISVSANNTKIEATEGVKIPAVTVKDGVSSFEINATVEVLSINTSKEISVAGKGNIGTLNVQGSGVLNINTTGKIGNLIVAEGKNATDSVKNFEQVRNNIEKVGGITNPSYTSSVQTPGVGGGGGGGGGGSSTGSNVLETAKTTAINELEVHVVATDYRAAEQTVLATAIQEGTAAINAATTTEGVTTALATAKVVIDGIKTAAQLTAEEAEALATAKTTAITQLESYVVTANYRAAEQAVLATAIQEGTAAINAATTTEGVTTALAAARVVIDGIKTAAQLTAEEGNETLATAKTTAITELEVYVVAANYRAAEQAVLATAIQEGTAAINAATTPEGVTTAIAAAKVVIDGIKTAAQLAGEEDEALAAAKTTAISELEGYVVATDYRAAEQAELATAIQDGKAAINAATTTEGVTSAIVAAKVLIDGIKTDAELTQIDELNKEIFSFTINDDGTVMITGLNDGRLDINIVIPSTLDGKTVTSIGQDAFSNKQLTSVVIPAGVTSIGDYAFSGNSLSTVTIPAGVTSIGHSAFLENVLTTVTIPGSVESIGRWAFESNGLETVVIEEGVESIGGGAFSTNNLTTVTIPGSVTSIGDWVFDSNELETVVILEGVERIGSGAFYNNNLTTVIIPGSVTSIGYEAFEYNQLTTVTIPGSVTSIGNYAFAFNQLTTVVIQEGVKNIEGNAFFDNGDLNSITIGSNVTIGENLTGENNNFKTAYSLGGAGTYHKQPNETWVKDNLQAPTIVEVKKISSANGYNKVQIKFSEPILDSTVDVNSFGIIGTNSSNQSVSVGISSFSTTRSDGTPETNPDNDEYITLSFSEKTTVDSLSYTKDKQLDYGIAKNLTNLTGTLLETQTFTSID